MPIYEYEPDDRDCLMCEGRVDVLQDATEDPLQYCPSCGLEVRRVISRASFSMRMGPDPDKAAQRGFTTWKKSGVGTWEKLAGPGVDVMQGSQAEIQAVKDEAKAKEKPVTKLDFDKP
jgi:putative FmdB family regulatory protein